MKRILNVLRDERGISEFVAAIALVAIVVAVAIAADPQVRNMVGALITDAQNSLQNIF